MIAALDRAGREAVVAEANRAPSVHNTQPVRWAFDADAVRLRLDRARILAVSDPGGYDAALSLGCCLEGTRIALARRGLGADMTLGADMELGADAAGATATLRVRAATSEEREAAARDHALMDARRTHRLGFAPPTPGDRAALAAWAKARDDVALVTDAGTLDALARRNDEASLRVLRREPFRAELLAWMRLRGADPRAARDGLSAASLGLRGPVARAAGLALGRWPFRLLDGLGLGGALVSERAHTVDAAGIAAVTMPETVERPRADVPAGVAFLRAGLELAALGHQTWPMGVLVDDEEARRAAHEAFEPPRGRVPRIVFRIGRPEGDPAPGARRAPAELID